MKYRQRLAVGLEADVRSNAEDAIIYKWIKQQKMPLITDNCTSPLLKSTIESDHIL